MNQVTRNRMDEANSRIDALLAKQQEMAFANFNNNNNSMGTPPPYQGPSASANPMNLGFGGVGGLSSGIGGLLSGISSPINAIGNIFTQKAAMAQQQKQFDASMKQRQFEQQQAWNSGFNPFTGGRHPMAPRGYRQDVGAAPTPM